MLDAGHMGASIGAVRSFIGYTPRSVLVEARRLVCEEAKWSSPNIDFIHFFGIFRCRLKKNAILLARR